MMVKPIKYVLWITLSVSLLVIPTLAYGSTAEASIKVENWTSATVTLKVQKPIFALKYYMTGDQKAENWHFVNISDSCHERDEEYDVCTVKDLKYNPLQYTYCIRHTPQVTVVDPLKCIDMENGPSDISPDVQHIIIVVCVLSSVSIIAIAYGIWRKCVTTRNINEPDNEVELAPPPYDEVVAPPPSYDEVVAPPPPYDEVVPPPHDEVVPPPYDESIPPPNYYDIFPFMRERHNNIEENGLELDQMNPENAPAEVDATTTM